MKRKDVTGQAPIHRAARKGHHEIVQFLLDQKCQPFPLDENGNTPLHLAAYWGHADVVKVLLSCGATESCTVKNDAGQTPLHHVGKTPWCKEVLEVLNILLDSGLFGCDDQDLDGNTPLHIAFKSENHHLARHLLSKTNCSIKNSRGETAMEYANSKGTCLSKTASNIAKSHFVFIMYYSHWSTQGELSQSLQQQRTGKN